MPASLLRVSKRRLLRQPRTGKEQAYHHSGRGPTAVNLQARRHLLRSPNQSLCAGQEVWPAGGPAAMHRGCLEPLVTVPRINARVVEQNRKGSDMYGDVFLIE